MFGAKLTVLLCLSGAALNAQQFYEYATFDVPGARQSFPHAINAAGQVCGFFDRADNGAPRAFLRDAAGQFTTFDAPNAAMTLAFTLNDYGQCAGQWSPDMYGGHQHAFVRNLDGSFISFDVPGFDVTGVYGINNAGQMAINALKEPGPYKSLFRNLDGTLSGLVTPGLLQGINNNGIVVGSPAFEGFINGEVVRFNVPGNTTNSTQAYGINSRNFVVGTYNSGDGYNQVTHGYLREPDGTFLDFNLPHATSTVPYGINDLSQVVGSFIDGTGIHGFIATPCREQRPLRSPTAIVDLVPAGTCRAVNRAPVHR